VVRCEKPWGETFTEAEARAAIERERPQVVAFVHGETSTGALQAPQAIARPARANGAFVIADCVTTLGAAPIHADDAGIDIAYSCSQKGLSCTPGLSPITVSPRAVEWLNARQSVNPVWYLDLKLIGAYFDDRRYHHTAPVSTFYALREALAAIRDEGVAQRFARHARAHESFVRRIEAMGLRMLVAPGHRIPNLNTVRVPEGVDDAAVRKLLLDEHGIEIVGGLGVLAGKIFRIGVMGPLATEASLDLFFDAFSRCMGVPAPAIQTASRT
jgi:alanine-glyoxylate transaminase/serine-glyoxylate transaminase/serine-pyruvate transaminase